MDNPNIDTDPFQIEDPDEFEQFGPVGAGPDVDEPDPYDQDDPDRTDPTDRALGSDVGDWMNQARIFGLGPARGEPDTRAVYDPDDAHTAVEEVMNIIATRLAPDGSPLAEDRDQILWGFVYVLNAQSERLHKRIEGMAHTIRELIHAQDGSEVRDNELTQKTDEARNLYDRALAFDRLTNTASIAYETLTDSAWRARESNKSTFSLTEPARAPKVSLTDHLKARTWLERAEGTRIAVVSGQRPGHALVWGTLSRLLRDHPDLVVVTGGNKAGADRHAAEWATQYNVPLQAVKPDFDAPDLQAELRARNTRIVHHMDEKGRKEEGAAIRGLVVFPGARTGVPGDLVAKARAARVPIAEIESAAQLHATRGRLMPGYTLDHNEFRPELDAGDTDPARSERRTVRAATAAGAADPEHPNRIETPRETLAFAINLLAERVTADGYQLNDEREQLLWGVVNVFKKQLGRLNGEARDTARDTDLAQETRDALSRNYDMRRDVFNQLFLQAGKVYQREARQPWNPDGYARLDHTHTLATLEAENLLKQVEQHRHEAIYRHGQYVVAAGGALAPEQEEAHRPVVDRYLDSVLAKYPDTVLVHGGNDKGYDKLFAEWAERNDVPQIAAQPEWGPHTQGKAPIMRNEKIFEKLSIQGLVAFGARGAILEDMIQRAGRSTWHVDPAAEMANLPTPVLQPDPDGTWEKIKADHTTIFQAAENKLHLVPYQQGFDDFRGLLKTAIDTGNHPKQHAPRLHKLRDDIDTEAERRDTVQTLQGRIEGLTDRLDGLKEWVAAEPGRPIELAPGFIAWLRDRDATVAQWNNAARNPELKDHLPRLGEDGMKAEIERLSNPDLPSLFHPALETGNRHMERVNNLYEHALAFVDRDPNLVAYSPHFDELRQTVRQVAGELVSQPDQVQDLQKLDGRLQASSQRQAEADAAARDLSEACTQVLGFQQWAAKTERPVHEAPNFKEWRDSADAIISRCETMRNDPKLAPHLERAGASAESTEVAVALLRDERFQRPVVPQLPAALQQARQESMEEGRSMSA